MLAAVPSWMPDSSPAVGKASDENEPDVRVRVKLSQLRTIADQITGLGKCEAMPQHFASSPPPSKVQNPSFKQPGDAVQAGDAIVDLDSTLADKNLKEKESARDSLKASLELLESLPRPEEQNSASWRSSKRR